MPDSGGKSIRRPIFYQLVSSMVNYTLANTEKELLGILQLQRNNLLQKLSPQEMQEEGFLSVPLDLPVLKEISGDYRHIIAKDGNNVVGYALVMLKEYKDRIPLLVPMFEVIKGLNYQNNQIEESSYFIMGQICVDKNYRGHGIFRGLYSKLKEEMSDEFDIVVTEVATRNLRSTNAHKNVGFKPLLEYISPEKEEWALVFWDWK